MMLTTKMMMCLTLGALSASAETAAEIYNRVVHSGGTNIENWPLQEQNEWYAAVRREQLVAEQVTPTTSTGMFPEIERFFLGRFGSDEWTPDQLAEFNRAIGMRHQQMRRNAAAAERLLTAEAQSTEVSSSEATDAPDNTAPPTSMEPPVPAPTAEWIEQQTAIQDDIDRLTMNELYGKPISPLPSTTATPYVAYTTGAPSTVTGQLTPSPAPTTSGRLPGSGFLAVAPFAVAVCCCFGRFFYRRNKELRYVVGENAQLTKPYNGNDVYENHVSLPKGAVGVVQTIGVRDVTCRFQRQWGTVDVAISQHDIKALQQ